MENDAFFGNTGQFRQHRLGRLKGLRMQESRQRCVQFVFPAGHGPFVLASRPTAEFYLRDPSFEVSYSFTDQVLAQLDFLRYWKESEACKIDLSG